MKKLLSLALSLTLVCGFGYAGDKFKLTGENTKVEFTGSKKDGKHDGGFKKLTGTVAVDGDITTAKIEVTIDMNSLYTDAEGLTKHLKNADFFEVNRYSTSKFTSTKIEKKGDEYVVTGNLNMHGVTKPVSFPAKIQAGSSAFIMESDFSINRTEWGMKFDTKKVDDKVALRLKVEAKN